MATINDLMGGAAKFLVTSANRIAVDARSFAKRAGSSRIAKSIKITAPKVQANSASITIYSDPNIAPQSAAFERGARQHPIDAVNAPNLVFEGTNQFSGQTIVTPHVNHPGMKARPFMHPATEKNRTKILLEAKKVFGDAIRLQIRSMAKKI